MDKTILNGSKARFYNQGNSQSGSIQYTDSKLSIKGNSAGSGVLITDGKLYLKSGEDTTSIIYDNATQGVQFPDGVLYIGTGSSKGAIKLQDGILNFYTDSVFNGNVTASGAITASNAVFSDYVSIGQYEVPGIGFLYNTNKPVLWRLQTQQMIVYDADSSGNMLILDPDDDLISIGEPPYFVTTSINLSLGSLPPLCSGSLNVGGWIYSTQGYTSSAGDIVIGGDISASTINANTGFTTSGYSKVGGNFQLGGTASSPFYASGFGGDGWSIYEDNGRHIAQFDDLWVRGSMNVYEMIINQIRATNGSLWVSDAAKAVSASIVGEDYGYGLRLQFETGSILPFVQNDILRSKRWRTSGSVISSIWDAIFRVYSVDYGNAIVQFDYWVKPYYTSSNITSMQDFAYTLSIEGSQWVRVGYSGSNDNRKGSIYLTSNDMGGPFLDVYNDIDTVAEAYGGISESVTTSKVKVRLGRLTGIVDNSFDPSNLQGYGLYSDNAYLKGTLSAAQGTFSGRITANEGYIGNWNINAESLYKEDEDSGFTMSLTSSASGAGLFVYSTSAPAWSQSHTPIYIGSNGKFSLGNQLVFDNGMLTISGIQAEVAQLGGWSVNQDSIYSTGITLSSATNPSIQIGEATAFDTGTGIFMSGSSATSYLRIGQTVGAGDKYLLWDGANLSWQTPNFTLSSAGILTLTGSLNATSGNIGGWTISTDNISSSGIQLDSSTPSIKLGAQAYGDEGIWFGKGNQYSMSLYNNTDNYLKWNGSYLEIKSQKLSLTEDSLTLSGSITTSNGLIGNWAINESGITHNISGGGTVSVTSNGTTDYIDFLDDHGNVLYNQIEDLYTNVDDNWENQNIINNSEILLTDYCVTSSGEGIGVKFYNYQGGIEQLLAFTISGLTAGKTYTFQSQITNFNRVGGLVTSGEISSPTYLWVDFFQDTNFPGTPFVSFLENPLYDQDYSESFASNSLRQYNITVPKGSDGKIYGVLTQTLNYSDGSQYSASFTWSGWRVDQFVPYSQLSDKGLFIWENPGNYIRLTAFDDYKTQSSMLAVDSVRANNVHIGSLDVKNYVFSPRTIGQGGTGHSGNGYYTHSKILTWNSGSNKIVSSDTIDSVTASNGITIGNTLMVHTITEVNATEETSICFINGAYSAFFDYQINSGSEYRVGSVNGVKNDSENVKYSQFGIVETEEFDVGLSVSSSEFGLHLTIQGGSAQGSTTSVFGRGM